MNKRTKSQTLLKTKKEIRVPLKRYEELELKSVELEDIQQKVQKSKPILQTIYDKVKRKQSRHQLKIKQQSQKLIRTKNVTDRYKELYEDGLRIISKNKIVSKFTGLSNYRNPLVNNSDRKNEQKEKRNLSAKEIVQMYKGKSKSKIQQRESLTGTNIFERYQQKLGQELKPKADDRNNIIFQANELNLQLKKDLEKIIKNRKKNKKDIPERQIQFTEQESKINKEKYLQSQKRKI